MMTGYSSYRRKKGRLALISTPTIALAGLPVPDMARMVSCVVENLRRPRI